MEAHAWTFKVGIKATQCASVIDGDFEHVFMKAEVVSSGYLVAARSLIKEPMTACRGLAEPLHFSLKRSLIMGKRTVKLMSLSKNRVL
jgi:hypothetical protein